MNTAPLHRALILTAWIAGAFCLLVGGVMVYEHFEAATNDPWKSPQLLALREKLAAEPKNEPLQKEIRQLDLEFRQKFRRRLALDKTGAWLLLGGALALVLAAAKAAALKRILPLPQPKPDAGEQSLKLAARARWSLAGVGLVVAGSLLIIRLGNTSVLPANQAAWQKLLGRSDAQEAPVEEAPALSEFQTNWPRFRGWDGSGAVRLGLKNRARHPVAFRHPRAGAQFADCLGGSSLHFRRHGGPAGSFLLQRFQWRAPLATGS